MTLTPPASSPARRPRRAARLTAWVAVAVLALVPAGAGAASAAQTGPGHGAVPGDQAGSIGLTIAPSGGGILQADQTLTISATVTNTTAATVAAADVHLSIGDAPLPTRDDLTAWFADGASTPTDDEEEEIGFHELGSVPIDAISTLGTQTGAVTLDPATVGPTSHRPGVYPLRGTYSTDAGSLTVASAVVVPGSTDADAAVGVVVPIVAEPRTEGLLTMSELSALTGPVGALTAQLDAVTATSAILAIDPAIPAAIRALGTSAPEEARAWLERLLALPNPRFALQFADADLASQVQAGVTGLLAPETLDPLLRSRDFAPQLEPEFPPEAAADASTPPTPTAQSTPAGPAFPTLAELTDIGQAQTDPSVLWPATGSAGADVVAGLAARSPASLIMLPSTVASAGSGARATAGGAHLLVYDEDVSTALTSIASADDAVARAAALAASSAYASVATEELDGRPLLVVVDRGPVTSRAALRAAITAASTLAGHTPTDLATLAAASPVTVDVDAVAADAERVGTLSTLLADEQAVAGFATILTDPSLLTAPERVALLQLIGCGWRSTPASWPAAVEEHRTHTRETLGAVGISPPSNINLLGSTAPLGFSVRNDLPWPVSLVLSAYPADPVLVVQNTTPVTAGAEQNTRVEVPVEARVGSGSTSIGLQLRSPSGEPIGESRSVAVMVRAEWESVWIAVFAAVVGILFAIGVVRTVLRVRRRSRDGTDAGSAEGTGDATGTESAERTEDSA